MATATVADDMIDPITGKKKATATDPTQPVAPQTVPIPTGGDAPPAPGTELKDVPATKPATLPAATPAVPTLPAPATALPPTPAIPPMVNSQAAPTTVPIPSDAPPAMAASGLTTAPTTIYGGNLPPGYVLDTSQTHGGRPYNETTGELLPSNYSLATGQQEQYNAQLGVAKQFGVDPSKIWGTNTVGIAPPTGVGNQVSTNSTGQTWAGDASQDPNIIATQLAQQKAAAGNQGAVDTLNQGVTNDQTTYQKQLAANQPTTGGSGLADLPAGGTTIPALGGTGQVTVPIPTGGDAPPATGGTELADVPAGLPKTLPVNPYTPVTAGPGTGSTSQTPIDPTNDLRSKLLTPATDPRLATTQNLTDQAAANLAGGPNFTDLASSKFKDFITQQNEQQATDVRTLGQNAAKFGTLGSGVNTGYLGDLQRKELQDRLSEADTLASNAAGQDVSQRQQTLAALLGVENSQFGQGQTNYQDVVQQQGWQGSQSQQAIDNAAKQEGLTEQEYMDKLYGGIALGNYGDSGNPSTTQASIAAQYGDAAASDWAALATLAGKQAYQAALSAGQSPAAAKDAAVKAGG